MKLTSRKAGKIMNLLLDSDVALRPRWQHLMNRWVGDGDSDLRVIGVDAS